MMPLLQGQLDGLCGVYSTINATRLIEKITREEAHRLFQKISRLIEPRKSLPAILANGLEPNDIAYILTNLIERQYPLKRFKPFHRVRRIALDLYWREVQGFLQAKESRAVILAAESWTWSHWTVIRKATPKTLFLFDSDNMKIFQRRHCTTNEVSKARPILLYPTTTYFLSRKD